MLVVLGSRGVVVTSSRPTFRAKMDFVLNVMSTTLQDTRHDLTQLKQNRILNPNLGSQACHQYA